MEELNVLKLIKGSLDKQGVKALSYPTIDRLCLKHYPDLVYEGKLSSLITALIDKEWLYRSEKGGVIISQKGLDYLAEN